MLLHRRFHTDAFTHRSFHTQHTEALYTQKKSQLYLSFWRSTLISCGKGCNGNPEIAFLPQVLTIEPRFARKGCAGHLEIAILPQFLVIGEPCFVRKGCGGHLEIAILPQFLAIEPHFVRKGCAGRLGNRNFTSVFGDRTSFRAKGLGFVPSRWHCPCPRLQKRNRKEGEGKRGKRARGQEEKM